MEVKRQIAIKAAKYLENYASIGFGSGSTVNEVLKAVNWKKNKAFSASSSTSIQLNQLGISERKYPQEVEIVVDGADQIVNDAKMFIKGGGGALMREKVLWEAARKILVVAEEKKLTDTPSFPLAIEVLPYAHILVKKIISSWEEIQQITLRTTPQGLPFRTDNGNWIFDVSYEEIDLLRLDVQLKRIPGVLETGIFKFDDKPITVLTERKEVEFF